MAYRIETGSILLLMGYEIETDFEVRGTDRGVDITTWNHGDAKPTDVEIDNFYTTTYLAAPERLDEQKVTARYDIDHAAEMARLRYITNGAGQANVYQEKGNEAEAYIAAGYPADLTTWIFIQAEVNATSLTATQAADTIIAQRSAWRVLGANIEEVRLTGKGAVDLAADVAGVNVAKDAAVVALDAI